MEGIREMEPLQLRRVLQEEIAKYEGFSADDVKLAGDVPGLTIQSSKGGEPFVLAMHPMLQFRYIDFVALLLDCLAMHAASMEVKKRAI